MQGSLNAMVVWIPIVDVDVPLGAIEIVPGSHRLGLLGTEADSWYRHIADPAVTDSSFVPVEVERGDVVCFSALLVHRSGNNVTDRIRWSMHFRYNDVAEATFVERGLPHPYTVYQPQPDLLTSDFPTPEEIARIFPAAT